MRVAWLALLLLAPLALAEHTPKGDCGPQGHPAYGIIWLNQGDGDPRNDVYVDDRNYLLGNGIWVYHESNGIWNDEDVAHALQRGGASFLVPGDRETCVDDPLVIPDTLIL